MSQAGQKILAGMGLGILLASLSLAAPVPTPRGPKATTPPLKRAELVGEWVMRWGTTDYDVVLFPNGKYVATSQSGQVWVGSWSFATSRKIMVRENITSHPDATPFAWTAKLVRVKVGGGHGYDSPHVSLRKAVR